jgi:hypothetical protein
MRRRDDKNTRTSPVSSGGTRPSVILSPLSECSSFFFHLLSPLTCNRPTKQDFLSLCTENLVAKKGTRGTRKQRRGLLVSWTIERHAFAGRAVQ